MLRKVEDQTVLDLDTMGNGRVLEGDAFDLFDRIPKESVDLIVTSPPYWGHREYGLQHNWRFFNSIPKVRQVGETTRGYLWYRNLGGVLGLEPYPEWYVVHLAEILSKAVECMKPDGNLWLNIGDTYFARWASIRDNGRQGLADTNRKRRKTPQGGIRQEKQLLLIPARFAIEMQKRGWILRNDLIWYKPNATPRPEGDRLKLSHEHFFHFVKKPRAGRPAYYYQADYAESRHNDVVTVNVAPGEHGHTATFPHSLIAPRILTSSPPAGIVLDPFCGTGRALEVARELGRRALGFDAQADFVAIAQGKISDMRSKKSLPRVPKDAGAKGNFISEWFGQRIYPLVRADMGAFSKKRMGVCPFLSTVLKTTQVCIKNENSFGVCTVSSSSNGPRQDWLVCPYRVIDSNIVSKSCQLIFGLSTESFRPVPVSLLKHEGELEKFKRAVTKQGRGFLFFQDKLGGEISVLDTDKSPEMAFDVTLMEVCQQAGKFEITRYGILELQTMDFHGSYKQAVSNLRDALRLHGSSFPETLSQNQSWAGENVEGPNIANVFKRTFYQIMLKFRLSGQGAAAGTVLALPRAVWDSWQPFLGRPEMVSNKDGIHGFKLIDGKSVSSLNSYICVFDIDANHKSSISPVTIEHFIRVSPEELSHHAFTVVPSEMMKSIQSTDAILSRIRVRLREWWPDIERHKLPKVKEE